MFGFFRNRGDKPSITPETKKWIETYFVWFVKIFGLKKLKEKPFFLLNHHDFPYTDLKDGTQFEKLFLQLCDHLEIDATEISFLFFDDFQSQQWSTYIPLGPYKEAVSIFERSYVANEKRYQIRLAQSNFENDGVLIAILMRELMQVKIVDGNILKKDRSDKQQIIELATIFMGMGIIHANASISSDDKWIRSNSYLQDREISYANALVCYLTETDGASYYALLNSNTKSLFKQNFEYLIASDDTALVKDKVAKHEAFYTLNKQIKLGFRQEQFDQVVAACKALEQQKYKTVFVYSNWGYALIKQKQYALAMEYINKAIEIDPFSPFPYNNRGYCKLNLNDLENALIDIMSSIDLDPKNGFAWRNLGACYLKMDDAETALKHFNTALALDYKTELIHFYLSKAYMRLNNQAAYEEHRKKSIEKKEYNDSTFS